MKIKQKITLKLLSRLSISENVVDDLLDQQMQQIDNLYGNHYDGLSNKVLSMFIQHGQRIPVSREDFILELREKRQLDARAAVRILDHLQTAGLLRSTSAGQYELASNTLAQRVDNKVAAENSLLRNMRVVIRDHITRGELLDQQYLDHIAPFITRLELDTEQQAFVARSQRAISQAQRRKRLLALAAILLLLGFTTVTTVLALRNNALFKRAQFVNAQLQVSEHNLREKNDILRETQDQLISKRDSLFNESTQKQVLINSLDSALLEARQAQQVAEAAQDSIGRANVRLSYAQWELNQALKRTEAANLEVERQRDTAIMARQEALLEKRQSDLLAISLNAAVRSLSVTNARTQALIARQAYTLYRTYVQNSRDGLDQDENHPYIFRALRESFLNLVPGTDRPLEAHNGSVNDILIAPDGTQIFTAGSDGLVKAWTIEYWQPVGQPGLSGPRVLDGLPQEVIYQSLDLSKDGKHLLISGQSNQVHWWDIANFSLQKKLSFSPPLLRDEKVYAAAFSLNNGSDGVIALTRDNYYRALPEEDSLVRYDFKRPTSRIRTRAHTTVSIDGAVLGLSASTSYDRKRFYINLQRQGRQPAPSEEINFVVEGSTKAYGDAVALAAQQSGNNGIVAIGLEHGHLVIGKVDLLGQPMWQDEHAGLMTFRPHQAAISDIAFSENGNYLAVASYDGTITVWDLRYFLSPSYQPLRIDGHRDWVRSVAFANQDRFLLAGTRGGNVYFWNFHAPDLAMAICDRLSRQAGFPNYDRLEDQLWLQFFGEKIERDDQICR